MSGARAPQQLQREFYEEKVPMSYRNGPKLVDHQRLEPQGVSRSQYTGRGTLLGVPILLTSRAMQQADCPGQVRHMLQKPCMALLSPIL